MAQNSDLKDLLTLLIEHSAIQQYYHVDVLPERKPLVVALDGMAPTGDLGLIKFGVPVVVEAKGVSGQGVLNVMLRPEAGGSIHFDYTYPAEGLAGSARFVRKDGKPALEGFRIIER